METANYYNVLKGTRLPSLIEQTTGIASGPFIGDAVVGAGLGPNFTVIAVALTPVVSSTSVNIAIRRTLKKGEGRQW